MTEYRIDTLSDGVEIEFDGVQPHQQAELLAAFGECQQGN